MPAKPAPVKAEVLAWAIAEDGRPLSDLADALKLDPETLSEWMAGDAGPSTGQVSKLAQVLQRPRALFFLPRPPAQATLPASFRHPPGDEEKSVGAAARRRVRQARRVQHAVAWALRDEEPIDFPRFPSSASPEEAAAVVRRWVAVSDEDQADWRDDYEALRAWRGALESKGVLVFALQIGRNDVRGFSAWDERAPMIVANTSKVSPAARCFTLAHELGHLVSRQDAACVDQQGFLEGAQVERWCERFGAAFLMPPEPMAHLAHNLSLGPQSADLPEVRAVARAFRVSHRAAALRLIEMGYATRHLYAEVLGVFKPKADTSQSKDYRQPPRSTSRIREYGPRTLDIVLNELPARDALSILRVTVEDVRRISEEVPVVQTSF